MMEQTTLRYVVARCVACAAGVAMIGGVWAFAQDKTAPSGEQERKVQEAEVPKAALDALKKLAAGAAITEFAEEIEHGHKFYEGSWKGAAGNVDGLVTELGDLVEIEEAVKTETVPAPSRATVEKVAGKDAKMSWEKKTVVLYEVQFEKDGKRHEMVVTPDGRQVREEGGDTDKDNDEEREP
jgi:hypothetical protein